MTLPLIEKTWQRDAGRDMGRTFGPSAEDLHGQFFLNVVNAWLGFPLNPPQVWGSSNGVTAGMDRVNRWLTAADLLWIESATPFVETDPRSWIVFKTTAFFVRFHLVGATRGSVHVAISKAGFTGGSTTACPTAMDGSVVGSSATDLNQWNANLDDTGTNRLQMFHSSDGRETRILFTRASDQVNPNGYAGGWIFGELADAPPAITKPYFAMFDYVTPTTVGAYQPSLAKNTAVFLPSGPNFATYMTEHSYVLEQDLARLGVGPCLRAANEISGNWPIQPIYIYDPDTGATLGRPKDLWLGANNTAPGTTIPEGGPARFAQFGPWIVPWPASWGSPVTGPPFAFVAVSEVAFSSLDGITGPIVVEFNEDLDPDSVVFEVLDPTGDPAPGTTFYIRRTAGGGWTPYIEIDGSTITILNGAGFSTTAWGPTSENLNMDLFVTTGILSAGGSALAADFSSPVKHYHVLDNSD
jgi:hypothetical protein